MGLRSIIRLMLGALCVAGATTAEVKLRVKVFDFANIDTKELDRALEFSSRTLVAAGVQPAWERGEAGASEGYELDQSVGLVPAGGGRDDRGYLVARFVRGVPASVLPGALGFALPSAQHGVNVTLFYDRIETVALSVPPGVAEILGAALAHELGHALLGSGVHSQRGIMKGGWTQIDYVHLAAKPLEFQPIEAAILRAEVSRREALWALSRRIGLPGGRTLWD